MKCTSILILVALFLHLCAGQYVDVDSVTVSSPAYLSELDTNTVVFSVTFTTYAGAAAIIEADDDDTRYMLTTYISDEYGNRTAEYNATLSSSMISTDLTDGTSNTWSSISTTVDLTYIECSNNSFRYFCVMLEPSSNASWGMSANFSDSGTCTDLLCRYKVDVGITSLVITNPDNHIRSGGGQAIEFDITILIDNSSSAVNGYKNWNVNAFLSADMTGDIKAVESDAVLSFSDQTASLAPGEDLTMSAAVTLDLTSLDCDDDYYFCAQIEPHSSAYWIVDDSGSLNDKLCITVGCKNSASRFTVGILSFFLSLLSVLISM